MSDFQCDYCDDYGMHSPNCPYIEHVKVLEAGAECGVCGEPLVGAFYCNIIGERATRRVCGECWDHAVIPG